jgi:MoxR-like ATPase
VWVPLVERIAQKGQARFTQRPRSAEHAPETRWIDHYLDAHHASYLWAGFAYPWDTLPADLAARLTSDVLDLFPLNEALMEQAESLEPHGPALLREQRADYTVRAPLPSIGSIIERVRARGFALSETTLRAYHVALQTRPLVILPGISGTGKTRLTRLYADAIHGIPPGADNPYYLLVAVQPDWHNARDLLGYYNALTDRYHPTPFLRFVLRAAADPQQPYFVCLDEMNLARPEYYLAPLLSALETSERHIDLGTPADEVQMVSGETLRTPLRLPLNLRVIGTVNIDESTYALSDKLLDRANVIELTEVDLPAFRATYADQIDDEVWRVLSQTHAILARAGQPFGYRTLEEIVRYLEQAGGVLPPQQALDLQIKQKILPRLRGEESPRLRSALRSLLTLLLGVEPDRWGGAAQVPPDQVTAAPLPESAEKVRRMLERLDSEGFTDFYG